MGDEPYRPWVAYSLGVVAVLLLAVFALTLTYYPANSQALCAPFAVMKARLAERHHEHEAATAIVSQRQILVLFLGDRGKTWTLVAVNTEGIACLMGSGIDWTPNDRGA